MMKSIDRKLMSALSALFVAGAASASAFAATQQLTLQYKYTPGATIPAAITIGEITGKLPSGFTPDWESLRLKTADGKELPYQIDDMDLSEGTSPDDELAFLYSGPVTLSVSDSSAGSATYPSAWKSMENDDGTAVVMSTDGKTGFTRNEYGIVRLNTLDGKLGSWAGNLGLLRYAGWPESTYWANKTLGGHFEATTTEEKPRIISTGFFTDTPVRATSVCLSESNKFVGLRLLTAVSVYTTGDVRVKSTFISRGYADLTKAQFISTDILGGTADAQHIMPVQRYLDWAEEMGKSPSDYWKSMGVLAKVDDKDYVAFKDTAGPKPAFWGAAYLFTSPERWRSNFSPSQGIGVAEMLLDTPKVGETLEAKLRGESWMLEGEWRTGYFRWIADEVVNNRKANGIKAEITPDMEKGDWSLHMIPGTKFSHTFLYAPYRASNITDAIKTLEARYSEVSSLSIK